MSSEHKIGDLVLSPDGHLGFIAEIDNVGAYTVEFFTKDGKRSSYNHEAVMFKELLELMKEEFERIE